MLFFLFVGFFMFKPSLHTQQKELKVLFVGNSYTYGNNLAHIVSILSESTNTKLHTRKSVIGGANLGEHWTNMVRPYICLMLICWMLISARGLQQRSFHKYQLLHMKAYLVLIWCFLNEPAKPTAPKI